MGLKRYGPLQPLIAKYKQEKADIERSIKAAKAAGRREMTLDIKDRVISRGEARIKVLDSVIADLEPHVTEMVLTIIRTERNGQPVIMLDYGDDAGQPTFRIVYGDVPEEVFLRAAHAVSNGFTVHFKGFDIEDRHMDRR